MARSLDWIWRCARTSRWCRAIRSSSTPYDLGVDIELCDAVQRLRFEQPGVRVVILGSGRDRVFCAGANIHMLAASTHGFKVNFCKYTNETRLDRRCFAAQWSEVSGGGQWSMRRRRLRAGLACDEILLIDDGSSTVALPEVPLLGVLPGTGGLTRLLDKRRVRRDRADVFSTLAEGIRGKRAVEWRLVDGSPAQSLRAGGAGRAPSDCWLQPPRDRRLLASSLEPLSPEVREDGVRYRFVELKIERGRRLATLCVARRARQSSGRARSPSYTSRRGPATSGRSRAFRELRRRHPAAALS